MSNHALSPLSHILILFILFFIHSTIAEKKQQQSAQLRNQRNQNDLALTTKTKESEKFIFTTLAIAGAVYGSYQAGDAIVQHVNAKEHVKSYKKGLEDLIMYSLSEKEFDLTKNNLGIMLIMNAWDNCLPLRGYSTAIWKELLLKRERFRKQAEQQKEVLKESLLDAKEVYDVECMIQSSAEDACKMFDEDHTSSIVDFFDSLSTNDLDEMNNVDIDTSSSEAVLLSLTITGVKLFAKGSEHFNQKSSLNKKMKAKEYSEWFSKLASYTGTGVSIIGAMFDPTGLSILSIAGSVAGNAGTELRARDQRIGWKEHYCPALDAALLKNKKLLKRVTGMTKKEHVKNLNYYGPIVNNVDCLERTTKELCLMPVERECPKQKKQRLCRMKKLRAEREEEDEDEEDDEAVVNLDAECHKVKVSPRKHHDNDDPVGSCYWNVNPATSGEDGVERCSACPYAYNHYRQGIPGFMTPTKEGIHRCEKHRSPNGEYCRFSKGTFKDQCCAQMKDEERINEDMCY